jgi:hypothetical protein
MPKRRAPQAVEFVAIPTSFYLRDLDAYVRAHLKSKAVFFHPDRPTMALDQPGGGAALESAVLDVAEALMLGDGVALSITGENIALPYVTRMFGVAETAELIRRGVIEFVGEADQPGFAVDPSTLRHEDGTPVPPGNPLAVTFKWAEREQSVYGPGGLDPEESATQALRRFASELRLDRRDIRELTRRAVKHTHVVPPDRVSDITARLGHAYAAGELEAFGLSPKIARDTNVYQDKQLFELNARVIHVENLLDFELDQYQMPTEWRDIVSFTSEASSNQEALRSVDRIMELRRAPNLKDLFRRRILRVEDIPRLREHRATRSFRRWLWSKPDPRDADAMVEDFLRDVTGADRTTVAGFMTRVARVAAFTFIQDKGLDALQMPPEVRISTDVAIATAALIGETFLEKFRIRPPSGFFDEVIEPALHSASDPGSSA